MIRDSGRGEKMLLHGPREKIMPRTMAPAVSLTKEAGFREEEAEGPHSETIPTRHHH